MLMIFLIACNGVASVNKVGASHRVEVGSSSWWRCKRFFFFFFNLLFFYFIGGMEEYF